MKKDTKKITLSREKAKEYMAKALVKRLNCVQLLVPYNEPYKGLRYASVSMKDILKCVKFVGRP